MVVFMPDVMHSIAKVFVACRNARILANGDGCSVIHCQAQAAPEHESQIPAYVADICAPLSAQLVAVRHRAVAALPKM